MLANTTDELVPDSRNINRSCDQCRKRKIKCDFQKPQCRTCDRRNKICTYNDPIRKRGPKPKNNETGLNDIETPIEDNIPDPNTHSNPSSLQTKPMPIPIKISYAEDVDQNCNLYPGCSPNSYSASDLCPSPYFNNLFISPGSSPNSSVNIAFSDLSLNSPSFSPSDHDSNLENIEYLNLNQPSPTDLDFNLGSNLSVDGFSGPFEAHSPDSTYIFSSEVEPISRLTELETFLLSIYYSTIHPIFPLIGYDMILPLLPYVDQDMSIRFLINCMCATAASSSTDPLINEQVSTFYSLALDSAPYVTDRNGPHFSWGSTLLKTYFNTTP